jgi:hypothetical protein
MCHLRFVRVARGGVSGRGEGVIRDPILNHSTRCSSNLDDLLLLLDMGDFDLDFEFLFDLTEDDLDEDREADDFEEPDEERILNRESRILPPN